MPNRARSSSPCPVAQRFVSMQRALHNGAILQQESYRDPTNVTLLPVCVQELVLLGGGHAHVEVVRSFGLLHHRHNQRANIRHAAQQPQSAQQMSPISTSRLDSGEEQPPYRVTLVNRGRYTPYSGMLPGHVSGFYSYEDCHIDLAHLARSCGASMVLAEACGLDLQVGALTQAPVIKCHSRLEDKKRFGPRLLA